MNIIKVTKINDDGSVNFEGYYGPEEVQFVLEVGINYLLQAGAQAGEEEEEEEDDDTFDIDAPDMLQ